MSRLCYTIYSYLVSNVIISAEVNRLKYKPNILKTWQYRGLNDWYLKAYEIIHVCQSRIVHLGNVR